MVDESLGCGTTEGKFKKVDLLGAMQLKVAQKALKFTMEAQGLPSRVGSIFEQFTYDGSGSRRRKAIPGAVAGRLSLQVVDGRPEILRELMVSY